MTTQSEIDNPILEDCWKKIGVWSNGQTSCPKLEQVIHCRNCEVYSKAGRNLLKREAPLHYIDEWTELLANKNDRAVSDTKAVMVFRLGDEWVALAIDVIRKVAEMGIMHRVPHHSNEVVRGMVSMKGELHICVSVGGLLGIRKGEDWEFDSNRISYSERLVITSMDNESYVFPVSEVCGVYRLGSDELQKPPSTISNSMSTYMTGIFSWQKRNIGLLDEYRLYNGLSRSLS